MTTPKAGTKQAKQKMAKVRSQKGAKSDTQNLTGNSDIGGAIFVPKGGNTFHEITEAICKETGATMAR